MSDDYDVSVLEANGVLRVVDLDEDDLTLMTVGLGGASLEVAHVLRNIDYGDVCYRLDKLCAALWSGDPWTRALGELLLSLPAVLLRRITTIACSINPVRGALYRFDVPRIKRLQRHGYDINMEVIGGSDGNVPVSLLHGAIAKGDELKMQLLLQLGADFRRQAHLRQYTGTAFQWLLRKIERRPQSASLPKWLRMRERMAKTMTSLRYMTKLSILEQLRASGTGVRGIDNLTLPVPGGGFDNLPVPGGFGDLPFPGGFGDLPLPEPLKDILRSAVVVVEGEDEGEDSEDSEDESSDEESSEDESSDEEWTTVDEEEVEDEIEAEEEEQMEPEAVEDEEEGGASGEEAGTLE